MTVMPSDVQLVIWFSISRIFVAAKYIIGVNLFFSADCFTNFIGDGIVFPAANQLSVSVTQKSVLLCVIIANLSVRMMSSTSLYGILLFVK